MKVSFIKYKNDSKSYKMAKGLGMDVFEIDSPELIDKKIEELEKDEYTTIFIPNNLACFSEQIYSKYKYKENIRIILTPSKYTLGRGFCLKVFGTALV